MDRGDANNDEGEMHLQVECDSKLLPYARRCEMQTPVMAHLSIYSQETYSCEAYPKVLHLRRRVEEEWTALNCKHVYSWDYSGITV